MKKLFVVLLALTAIGVAAFAQDAPVWTFGAVWNTGAVITMGDSTSVPDATIMLYDNNEPTIVRARFIGQVDLDGFGAKWYVALPESKTIYTPALAFTNWWVYANVFNKMVQINVGAMDNSFSGTVNKGYGGASAAGFQIVAKPIDGLQIGVDIPVSPSVLLGDVLVKDQFAAIQIGAFYTMPNLASFALTYVNSTTAITGPVSKSSEFDFGVNVLAVPNLTAQFEGKLALLGDTVNGSYELFQNAAYVMGPLTPALALTEDIYAVSGSKMKIAINPSIDYMVMTGSNVGLSLTYTMNSNGQAGGTVSGLNVDPYVKFTFNPKAAVKIDANYTIPDLTATATWNMPININFLYSF
jgi:hypothetical protein